MRHEPGVFRVALVNLEEGPNRLRLEGSAADAEIAPEEADVVAPIVLEGTFVRSDNQVEVQARLRTRVRLTCDRCLSPVEEPVESELRLLAEKRGERDHRSEADRRAEDVGLLYHDGRTIDLRTEVRETVLLEVPMHPLCRPDCKGLCPQCGRDRNQEDCDCAPERPAGPWDVLRRLQQDDDAAGGLAGPGDGA